MKDIAYYKDKVFELFQGNEGVTKRALYSINELYKNNCNEHRFELIKAGFLSVGEVIYEKFPYLLDISNKKTIVAFDKSIDGENELTEEMRLSIVTLFIKIVISNIQISKNKAKTIIIDFNNYEELKSLKPFINHYIDNRNNLSDTLEKLDKAATTLIFYIDFPIGFEDTNNDILQSLEKFDTFKHFYIAYGTNDELAEPVISPSYEILTFLMKNSLEKTEFVKNQKYITFNLSGYDPDIILGNCGQSFNEPYSDPIYFKLPESINLSEPVYENEVQLKNENQNKNSHYISIPIGHTIPDNSEHCLNLGGDSGVYSSIIAGQPGRGKSVLIYSIILNGLLKYSNYDLQFRLLNLKGVEYFEFENINQLALTNTSDVETAVFFLLELENEIKLREELLRSNKSRNIEEYNLKCTTPIPKLLVIIDEFQVLFSGTLKQSDYAEKILINKIVREGRAFGIYLIVCTQSLGSGVRRTFLDNIPLRIALGMNMEQSQSFLSLKNTAANNLSIGEAIYNSGNGDLNSNIKFKSQYYSTNDIEEILKTVYSKK